MRKLYKISNMALIFMLWVSLCVDSTYALRVPLCGNRTAQEFFKEELTSRLSSDNTVEIDDALKYLDEKIGDPDEIVSIIERVLLNKGLCLRTGKVAGSEGSVVLFIDKKKIDKYIGFNIGVVSLSEIVGYRNFIPSLKGNYLTFTHGYLFDNKPVKPRQRIFPLMYRWMAAHSYFRNRYSGWEIHVKSASASSTKALMRSGFDDVKVYSEYENVSPLNSVTVQDIKEIRDWDSYMITARLPRWQNSSNQDQAIASRQRGGESSTSLDDWISISLEGDHALGQGNLNAATLPQLAEAFKSLPQHEKDAIKKEIDSRIYMPPVYINPDFEKYGFTKEEIVRIIHNISEGTVRFLDAIGETTWWKIVNFSEAPSDKAGLFDPIGSRANPFTGEFEFYLYYKYFRSYLNLFNVSINECIDIFPLIVIHEATHMLLFREAIPDASLEELEETIDGCGSLDIAERVWIFDYLANNSREGVSRFKGLAFKEPERLENLFVKDVIGGLAAEIISDKVTYLLIDEPEEFFKEWLRFKFNINNEKDIDKFLNFEIDYNNPGETDSYIAYSAHVYIYVIKAKKIAWAKKIKQRFNDNEKFKLLVKEANNLWNNAEFVPIKIPGILAKIDMLKYAIDVTATEI